VDALHGIDNVTKHSIYLIDRAMGAYADADTDANKSPTSERVKSTKFKSGTCGSDESIKAPAISSEPKSNFEVEFAQYFSLFFPNKKHARKVSQFPFFADCHPHLHIGPLRISVVVVDPKAKVEKTIARH
jgi:hypothetical protein